jgi:hypothetical protein
LYYYYIYSQVAEVFKLSSKSNLQNLFQGLQSYSSSIAKLFILQLSKPNTTVLEDYQTKYQVLFLDFVVSNNLVLQVVDL